ncbi:S41 family peptidase, partial [bacterium]|nr:S41 family peptidase [bacterium]
AAEAGLTSSDRIVEIEGESTKGVTIYDAIKLLKGEPGTQVTLTIARKGEADLFKRTVTRAIIHTRAVENDEVRMLDGHIGYVRLRDFTRDAGEELEASIRELQNKGMDAMVLDLRDNVGGLLDVAVKICDLFIDKGEVIVSHHKNRTDYTEPRVYRAQREPIGDFLLAVLVNEFSASASEIVAGCIQDHGRGVIVGPAGHRTFGKGSVQTLIEAPELQGGALKLTTAKYYTPSGRSISDDKGLLPDVFAQVNDELRIAIRRAGKVGVLPKNISGDEPKEEPVENLEDGKENPKEPITVEEVFSHHEDDDASASEDESLYDEELFAAYQCLKGASVLSTNPNRRYSLANPGN